MSAIITEVSINEEVRITKDGTRFLFVNNNSRDALVGTSVFLSILRDMVNDIETKLRIDRTINHLSDMLYGFDEREGTGE